MADTAKPSPLTHPLAGKRVQVVAACWGYQGTGTVLRVVNTKGGQLVEVDFKPGVFWRRGSCWLVRETES